MAGVPFAACVPRAGTVARVTAWLATSPRAIPAILALALVLRLAVIFATEPLIRALDDLAYALKGKAVEFADVLKMGRTQLQDAVPMTLGQEFDGFHATIKEDVARITEIAALFREVNLGATAIGTGINADPKFGPAIAQQLKKLTGVKFESAENYFEGMAAQDAAVELSGQLKTLAVGLMKIANDLRWMNSGPLAGLGEIEAVALIITLHDNTITMAATSWAVSVLPPSAETR